MGECYRAVWVEQENENRPEVIIRGLSSIPELGWRENTQCLADALARK